MSQGSNRSGELGRRMIERQKTMLERAINDKMITAHSLAGAVREAFILDEVFPLLDQANKAGYSVEFDEKGYYLEEVGERWTRITHGNHSS